MFTNDSISTKDTIIVYEEQLKEGMRFPNQSILHWDVGLP